MRFRSATSRVALLTALATGAAAPAFAQEEPSVAEVVVTAQKREERLQDVPIAISAMDSKRLEAAGVATLENLNGFAPNVQIKESPASATTSTISIRGGVTINPALSYDPSVGVYVDGVYVGKSQGSIFDVADIERVEVLRGPQGTLYGRNTLAGAVNFITKKPSGEFGGEIKAGVGSYDQRTLRADIDLPAWGPLSAKVSASRTLRDGYAKVIANPISGVVMAGAPQIDEIENLDSTAARLALHLDASETLQFDYSFDYSKNDQTPKQPVLTYLLPASKFAPAAIFDPASPNYVGGGPFGGQYFGFPLNLYQVTTGERPKFASLDAPQFERTEIKAHTLTGSWDVTPELTLRSITGYREMTYEDSLDLDGSPLPIGTAQRLSDYNAFSQEIQAVGSIGPVNYVAGVYYFEDDGSTINPQKFFGGAQTFDSRYGFGTKNYAVYGQADWKPAFLNEQVRLTVGGRYTDEEKRTDRFLRMLPFPPSIPAGTTAKTSFDSFTPLAIVAYEPNSRLNFYAKYAEGFKSGGFNGEAATTAEALRPYSAEKVKSYELGAKTSWLGGRLVLNGALFLNKHEDMQIAVFTAQGAAATAVRNAGEATTRGVELELNWLVTDWLTLQGSYGYLDGEYDKYIELGVDVAKNRPLPYSPKSTASLTATAKILETDVGTLRGTLIWNYTDDYFVFPFSLNRADLQNAYTTRVKSYSTLDGRLVLADMPFPGGTTGQISLWGKNLLNDQHATNAIDFGPGFGGLTVTYYGAPRTVGLELGLKW